MYLIDTNILLEFLLDQERAYDVDKFLHNIPVDKIFISEFSLYSIGVILIKHKKYKVFQKLINEMIINGNIKILRLSPYDMERIIEVSKKFNIDFDDAYQYTLAEKHDLTIISFDKDFDKTDRGRKIPSQIL